MCTFASILCSLKFNDQYHHYMHFCLHLMHFCVFFFTPVGSKFTLLVIETLPAFPGMIISGQSLQRTLMVLLLLLTSDGCKNQLI